MVDLINTVNTTGIIPNEWLISTFVMIPKKPNSSRECADHRTISIMSHTLKILLKIIHSRIYNKLENEMSDTQFGFRNGLGTREALFCYNVLVQRCLDVNKDVYICFIDYAKAFDSIRYQKLLSILKSKGIDQRDINNTKLICTITKEQR